MAGSAKIPPKDAAGPKEEANPDAAKPEADKDDAKPAEGATTPDLDLKKILEPILKLVSDLLKSLTGTLKELTSVLKPLGLDKTLNKTLSTVGDLGGSLTGALSGGGKDASSATKDADNSILKLK